MRFGDLTYIEIRELSEAGCVAVLPTGCIQQQGLHLPVDLNTWLSETLCVAASRRALKKYHTNSLVLPVLPFGPTPEQRGFGSGYIHIPQDVHEQVVASVLGSLAEQGFGRIVVWRGCTQDTLEMVVGRFNDEQAGRCHAFLPNLDLRDAWCRSGGACVSGAHAGSLATSIALYLRPESVRVALIRDPQCEAMTSDDPDLDVTRHWTTGDAGDAHASAELGKRVWTELVDDLARALAEISRTSV